MTHTEKEIFLNALASALLVKLTLLTGNEAFLKHVPAEVEQSTVEQARIWLAGYHAAHDLADNIADALSAH